MSYITKADGQRAVASVLRLKGPDSLPAHYDKQVDDALEQAYQLIREVLIGRGYTVAQLDAWDARRVYSRQIFLCLMFENGSLPDEFASSFAIDRACKKKEELLTCTVIANGLPVDPTGPGGGVGYGDDYDDDDDPDDETDRFTRDTVL